MVWSGPRCCISKHSNSLEQQYSSILGPSIVGIGYLLHMKTKTEYISERPWYLRMYLKPCRVTGSAFQLRVSTRLPHSLPSFPYATRWLLRTCLPLRKMPRIRPSSCSDVFGEASFYVRMWFYWKSEYFGYCCSDSDAGLLARNQYPEGPATGHLATGFSWLPCV
jgi:hypothetical protein